MVIDMTVDEDLAELIASCYQRASNLDEFIKAMNDYPYIETNAYILFSLCNKTWHGGYHEGIESMEL